MTDDVRDDTTRAVRPGSTRAAPGTVLRALAGVVLGTLVVPLAPVVYLERTDAPVYEGLAGLTAAFAYWCFGLTGVLAVLALVVIAVRGSTGSGGAWTLAASAYGCGLLLAGLPTLALMLLPNPGVNPVLVAAVALVTVPVYLWLAGRTGRPRSVVARAGAALLGAAALVGAVMVLIGMAWTSLIALEGL